ncbi:MAG: hypothetical protein J5994_10120 [Ruminococcus sp.]|nr:hypothetical protein [Ruminococcus sp.]
MAYSENRFNAMQEEAVRRVREMQRRSRSMVDEPPKQNGSEENAAPAGPPENTPPGHPGQGSGQPDLGGLLGSLLGGGKKGELFSLGGIKIDEEKALIGMLIYILYKQGADVKLLLGLGYLLL